MYRYDNSGECETLQKHMHASDRVAEVCKWTGGQLSGCSRLQGVSD